MVRYCGSIYLYNLRVGYCLVVGGGLVAFRFRVVVMPSPLVAFGFRILQQVSVIPSSLGLGVPVLEDLLGILP